jgi:cytochrome c-type biogenesis protein CcmF
MAPLGTWALVLVLAVSAYTAVAAVLGARKQDVALLESVRNGVWLGVAWSTVASGILLFLLLGRDFSVRYVYEHTSSDLALAYTLSAFWAGQEGSLLLWLWFATVLGAVLAWQGAWKQRSGLYALVMLAGTQAFLALVLLLASNPFRLLSTAPVEGQGLNPLLQNFWMVAHPPVVFAGYAVYTVPFALALAGLIVGQLDATWLRAIRRWALLAWLLLGAGILMGAWWAYLELGWGGYWGWDPVENSSLIPWLTGTALLHSLMMQQQRRAFRAWNLWLIALTFLLCVFATFVTRSGIIQSVHAFGRSSIGYYFIAYIAACLAILAWWLYRRRAELRHPFELRRLLSREAGLLLTNWLFLGMVLVILIGTLFPTLTEVIQRRQATLDAAFYRRTVGPLAQAIVLLLGICPWLAWGGVSFARLRRELLPPLIGAAAMVIALLTLGIREALALVAFAICAFVAVSLLATFFQGMLERRRRTGESWPRALWGWISTSTRRSGAHIVHLGIVLIAVGIAGSSSYQEEVQVALAPGQTADVGSYVLAYQDLTSDTTSARQQVTAVVDVYRGSKKVATLRPQKALYWNIEQWVTEVAIRSTAKEDLYLILAGFEQDRTASFRVLINPLVIWLWIGGAVLLLGGVMAWWPTKAGRSDGE